MLANLKPFEAVIARKDYSFGGLFCLAKVTWWTELEELKKGEKPAPKKLEDKGLLAMAAATAGLIWLITRPTEKAKLLTDEEIIANVRRYDYLTEPISRINGIPSNLTRSIIARESKGEPNIPGPKGEIGLMQITEIAARDAGYFGPMEALWDPAMNIQVGTLYLRKQYDRVITGRFPSLPYREAEGLSAEWWNTVSAYNAGQPDPRNADYVERVKTWLIKFERR